MKLRRITKGLSQGDILGDLNTKVKTRRQIENILSYFHFTSKIEPERVNDALNDLNWIVAMQ